MSKERIAERIKQALQEVREHRHLFNDETFSQIILALLDRLRRYQTRNDTSSATPDGDEIRLVTVLFVDIKDSTTLARSLDASDWKNLLAQAHERVAAVVTRWEGTVGQYLGDGVLIFFGASRSRGDDALRAVACGLDVLEAIDAFANEVFLQYGIEFAVRIGISTGKLVVGMIGGNEKQELLALGPATNLAARLQGEAPAGGILIDHATYQRVRHQFAVQMRPVIKVKGYDEPLQVYLVLGRKNRANATLTTMQVAGIDLPFVGRENTVAEIMQVLRTASTRSEWQLLTIIGEIGIGKSRLLQEVINRASADVFLPLPMVAYYETRGVPYSLLQDFLVKLCGVSFELPPATREQLIVHGVSTLWDNINAGACAVVLGYLAGFGFDAHPLITSLPAKESERKTELFQWVSRFFQGLSQQNPILIVVDNLQWADPESRRLLNYLVRDLQGATGALLAAARSSSGRPSADFFDGYAPHLIFTLERFNDQQSHQLIHAVLGEIDRVPQEIVSIVEARSEGNPLFIVEFLMMLFDTNVFQRGANGAWRFNVAMYDQAFKTLPTGLLEVVQARIDDLSPEQKQGLQYAAVVGQTFWSGALEELLGKDPQPILASLVARGILMRRTESMLEGETEYTFRQALYCDVAYQMIPRIKRESYHRDVARWLVTRVPKQPKLYATLAHQFNAGGQHDAALYTYLEAARHAAQHELFEEALQSVEQGFKVVQVVPRHLAVGAIVKLYMLQAYALLFLGRSAESVAASENAIKQLAELDAQQQEPLHFEIQRVYALTLIAQGDLARAEEALAAAARTLDKQQVKMVGKFLRTQSILRHSYGRTQEALALAQEGLLLIRHEDDPRERAKYYLQLGNITLERGDFATALQYNMDALECVAQYGGGFSGFWIYQNLGMIYQMLNLFDQARNAYEEALHIAPQHPDKALVELMIGFISAQAGDSHRAYALMRLLSQHEILNWHAKINLRLVALDLHLLAGENQKAVALGEETITRVDYNPLLRARIQARIGRARALLGEPKANELLQQSLEVEETQGGRELVTFYVWLAEASTGKTARRYYQRAASVLQNIGSSLYGFDELQNAFFQVEAHRRIFAAAGIG